MANPLSMQVLLEEIGTLKTLLAAEQARWAASRQEGLVLYCRGPRCRQIDDVLGKLAAL